MNSTNFEKTIGYVLLVVGLLLIIVPLCYTYFVLMGKMAPPHVFGIPATPQQHSSSTAFDIQQQVQSALQNILPLDLINNVLSLASWLLLMWILIIGGRHLAEIGIKLLKTHAQA